MADLQTVDKPESGNGHASSAPLTLAKLAAVKCLPLDFLLRIGLLDMPGRGVGITYRDDAGGKLFVKVRHKLRRDDPPKTMPLFSVPRGTRLAAYGDWMLECARRLGRLAVGEGESDSWTCWYHDRPWLGLPGANNAHVLTNEHIVGIDKLYIHREPDKGGDSFVAGVIKQLQALGFTGKTFVFNCGAKDPSDLHVLAPDKFKQRFDEAIAKAAPIDLGPPRGEAFDGEPQKDRTDNTCGPDPIPLSEIPHAPTFPLDVLPRKLARLVEEISVAMNCPHDFAGVPLLALAGRAHV